jgi:hypothetical protein
MSVLVQGVRSVVVFPVARGVAGVLLSRLAAVGMPEGVARCVPTRRGNPGGKPWGGWGLPHDGR